MSLLVVWSPTTLIVAVLAGLGVGYWIVGRIASDPVWVAGTATPRGLGILTILLAVAIGLVFYAGQTAATWAENDDAWPRVVSRFGLWVVYSVFLGLGTWRRVADHLEARRTAARLRAKSELGR